MDVVGSRGSHPNPLAAVALAAEINVNAAKGDVSASAAVAGAMTRVVAWPVILTAAMTGTVAAAAA